MTRALEPAPQLIGRKAAHALQLVRYFTGRPCINGHTAQRYVVTGACIQCSRDAQLTYARGKNGAHVWVKVRVPKKDADVIRNTATMLNAAWDARQSAEDQAFDGEAVRAALGNRAAGNQRFTSPKPSKPHGKESD